MSPPARGGDLMPWYFRRTKAGPLIGMRTWGGLVGILGYPALMDGGTVTAPNVAFWSPEGKWEVENTGVAPISSIWIPKHGARVMTRNWKRASK